jgi:hypothetical protein
MRAMWWRSEKITEDCSNVVISSACEGHRLWAAIVAEGATAEALAWRFAAHSTHDRFRGKIPGCKGPVSNSSSV